MSTIPRHRRRTYRAPLLDERGDASPVEIFLVIITAVLVSVILSAVAVGLMLSAFGIH